MMLRYIVLILGCSVTSGLRLPPAEDSELIEEKVPEGLQVMHELGLPDEIDITFDHFEDSAFSLSPKGWLRKKSKDKPQFFQMHIPRTAGSSLSLTLKHQSWLPEGSALYSDETCWGGLKQMMKEHAGESHIVTVVRDPVSHVYSMATRTHGDNVDIHKYIDHFYKSCGNTGKQTSFHVISRINETDESGTYDMGANYSPCNMQTRSFTCTSGKHNANHQGSSGSLSEAIANLDNTSFVLIQKYYKESLCVMHAKLHGGLPDYCDCRNAKLWAKEQPLSDPHGKKYHSGKHALTKDDERKVASFAEKDTALYAHALARFNQEVLEVQKTYDTQILCEK